ncbi:MAG TPA: hypothetical protein VD864_04520, partial [Nocardioides sp.]|nr:hypothetical protein [Nocardioides sp.]
MGNTKLAAAAVTTAGAVLGAGLFVQGLSGGAAAPPPASTPSVPHPGPTHHHDPGTTFDTTARSTTDPTSIWVVVNKSHPIRPLDFRPELALVRGYQVAVPAAAPL